MNTEILKHGFRVMASRILQKCSQCPRWASTHDLVRLNSDCLTCWKTLGVNQIIPSPFCIHCCKFWISLTAAAYRVTFRCSQK